MWPAEQPQRKNAAVFWMAWVLTEGQPEQQRVSGSSSSSSYVGGCSELEMREILTSQEQARLLLRLVPRPLEWARNQGVDNSVACS